MKLHQKCAYNFTVHGKWSSEYLTSRQALSDALDEVLKDKDRLDFLDAKGAQWIARDSSVGRGYRLHQDTYMGKHVSARVAIDAAIEKGDGK